MATASVYVPEVFATLRDIAATRRTVHEVKRDLKGARKVLRDRLAVHPKAADMVLALLQNPTTGRGDMLALVQTDPALAAAVMRAANSVHLGYARQIGGIRQANVMLGETLVSGLVAGRVADRVFDKKPMDYPEWLWPHSIVMASTCAVLARRTAIRPDEAYTLGLLHDVGWLMAASNHHELSDHDRSHGRLGADMLSRWNFPELFVQAVHHHHATVDASVSPQARLLIAAHAFAAELGANGPEASVSVIEAMHIMHLDVRASTILNEIESELVTQTSILEPAL